MLFKYDYYAEVVKVSNKNRHNKGILQNLALISQVGIMMLVPIIGGVLVGAFLDRLAKTTGIFLIIFVILGVGSAFRNLYVLSVQQSKTYKNSDSPATYVSKFERDINKHNQDHNQDQDHHKDKK